MGRVRRSIPRSRVPIHRQLLVSPDLVRRWLLVVTLGGITALLVGRSITGAQVAQERWGTTRSVVVTRVAVDAGDPLDGTTVIRRWPDAIAPADALTELPAGARAAADLGPGMPLSAELVRHPDDDTDTARRVRVAVPLGPGSMALTEGDVVDLWSTIDPSLSGATGPRGIRTTRVAQGAVVANDSDGRHVVVAVDASEAEGVVQALAVSTVTMSALG